MKNKVITLRVLAITIIILLILAGITILTLTGENGLLAKIIKPEIEDIEISYSLGSYENNIFKMNMIITSKESIITDIKFPDDDVLRCNGRNRVSIDYEFEEDVDYTFVIKTADGKETTEVANFKMSTKPIINDNRPTYLILTLEGVEKQKISIEYDERKDYLNYYSIDGGKNWNLYIGEFEALSEDIMAKSVHTKCSDVYIETKMDEMNEGTIRENAFDGNEDTVFTMFTYPNKYEASVLIDKELWNKNIEVNLYTEYASMFANGIYLAFIDDEENIVGENIFLGNPAVGILKISKQILIPKSTYKMKVYYGYYQGPVNISEIRIVSEPVINSTPQYSKITNEKIQKEYSSVSIDYFVTSIQKFYKIDDGEWNEYIGTINVEEGKTIYAKGIDKNGIETKISQEKIVPKLNTISYLGFDGDDTTYCQLNNYPIATKFYIEIDDTAIGRNLNFNVSNQYFSFNGGDTTISFVDENFNNIKSITSLSNNGTIFKGTDVEIPINSRYFKSKIIASFFSNKNPKSKK